MTGLQRSAPAYVQIAEHYRELITNGTYNPGEQLPTVNDLAVQWDVSPGTANKAMRYLAGEGLVRIERPAGTTVLDRQTTPAPKDYIQTSSAVPGDQYKVTSAELLMAPEYVASLLGLEEGSQVVRREFITYRQKSPFRLTVTWTPGVFASHVPELTSTEQLPSSAVGLLQRAERTPKTGHDYITGRSARDQREATSLNVNVGDSITAITYLWMDNDDVLEYGEIITHPHQVIQYNYTFQETQ